MSWRRLWNAANVLAAAHSSKATGIVWAGPIFDPAGYGNVSRNYLLGLARMGVPLRAVNLGADRSHLLPREVTGTIRRLMESDAGRFPVEIVHYEPTRYSSVRNAKFPVARIGCTIFETDRIPEPWVKPCNKMDEIWVPSEFNRNSFARSGVKLEKLRVVPYSLDTEYFAPTEQKFALAGLRQFCFLYVSFWDWRKGFDLLLEAYLSEFSSADDVSLVIRTNDPDPNAPKSAGEVRELLMESVTSRVDLTRRDLPHLTILTEPLTQDELKALYNTCDLYISTDRANGWGMPCMEVMSIGKPAATIDWSGSTQFMNADNSLLIKPTGRLIPVDPRLVAARPLYKGQQWAEVSVAEVRRVMRRAYEKPDELKEIAAAGMDYVRRELSLSAGAANLCHAIVAATARKRRVPLAREG